MNRLYLSENIYDDGSSYWVFEHRTYEILVVEKQIAINGIQFVLL